MARSKDPFSGIKLTEQVGLDQKLFSADSSAVSAIESPDATVKPPLTQETGKEASQGASFPRSKEASQEASNEAGKEAGKEGTQLGSLDEAPVLKNSFLYTEEEWNLFDDLKLDLRRKHGLKATKNDLARAAIRFLADDYDENKEGSFLVKKLPRK